MSAETQETRIATRRGVLTLAVAAFVATAACVAAAVFSGPLPAMPPSGAIGPPAYFGYDLSGDRLLVLLVAAGWPVLTLALVFALRWLWRPRTVFWARSALTMRSVGRPAYGLSDGLTDAAVLGLAAGVAIAVAFDVGVVGVAVTAVAVVAALALATGREAEGLARAVAGLAPLGPALLAVASERTVVTVVQTAATLPHPWFSPWLAAGLAVLGWIVVVRLGAERAARPVAMLWAGLPLAWLLTAALPGEIRPFDLRSEGETLVFAFAALDGRWPWAELSMIHGPWVDAGRALVGMTVFEPTRWGAVAGQAAIVGPMLLAGNFALFAWLSGWRWPHAALATLAAVWLAEGGVAGPILWAPTLAALALLLVRCTVPRSLLLVGLAAAQVLLVPASLAGAAAVAAVVLLRDLCAGAEPPRQRFRRSLLCVCWAVPLVVALAGALALTEAGRYLRPLALAFDFAGPVDGSRIAGGAFGLETVPALAVLGVTLAAIATVAGWSLVVRRGLDPRDGVIVAAGLFALSALPGVMGGDAVGLSQVAAVPVAAVLVRMLSTVEARLPRPPGVPHPVVVAALLLMVAAMAVWPRGGLALDPEAMVRRLRPTATASAEHAKLGFGEAGVVDPAMIDGWRLLLEGWVPPRGRILDLTGRPGLFHVLLDYRPTGRFLHAALAVRPAEQEELATALDAEKPAAVILPTAPDADGIPATVRLHRLSSAVLERYVPVVGFPDGVMLVPRGTELADPSLYGQAVACDWGRAAGALALPPPVEGPSEWPSRTLSGPETARLEGSLDAAAGPVDLVVALLDGRPIADERPGGPGLAADRFRITVQVPRDAGRRVRLAAAMPDGGLRPIQAASGIATEGEDGAAGAPAGRIETREIEVYEGVRLLEPLGAGIAARAGLRVAVADDGSGGRYFLDAQPPWSRDGSNDAISFTASATGRTVVPVAACPQWWSRGGGPRFLWDAGGGAPDARVTWEVGSQ